MGAAELGTSERLWWRRPDDAIDQVDEIAHQKLHACITYIQRTQDRKREWLLYGAMYGGANPPAAGGSVVDAYIRSAPGERGTIGLNVSRNVVDAVTSRVFAKSKPRLTYATEGGGPEKQENAKKLELGVEGAFYNAGAYGKFTLGGRDGCIYGTGSTCIDADHVHKKVRVERWRPWEYIVDDGEVLYGTQRSFYGVRYHDKFAMAWAIKEGKFCRELLDIAEGDRDFIAGKVGTLSGMKDEDAEFGYQQVGYRIRVEYGWRLPSGPGAKDGRRVIGVENCTILDEEWEPTHWDRPVPFCHYKWSEPPEGFYGQGLVELGQTIAAEINKLVRQIQNGHHLITGHWLVETGSKVVVQHINNDLSRIMKYTGGNPPRYEPPTIISPEVYQHLWNLVQKYYEIAGINQQAAQAQKPQGVNSGEAQRVYADQQTETLLDKGQRFEDYVRLGGQLVTDAAKELSEEGAYEVRALADDGFETIDWKKLDDPDGYELRVAPTSQLPGTPSGKIDLANDLAKLPGADFDGADILEIVGMPDMLQKTRMKQASRLWVEKVCGQMLVDGIPFEPDPMMNLEEAIVIARDMYCNAAKKGTPDEKLNLLRQFEATAIKMKTPPPAPATQGAAAQVTPTLGPAAASAMQNGVAPPGAPAPAPPPTPQPAAA